MVLYVCKKLPYSQALLENQGHLNEIHYGSNPSQAL